MGKDAVPLRNRLQHEGTMSSIRKVRHVECTLIMNTIMIKPNSLLPLKWQFNSGKLAQRSISGGKRAHERDNTMDRISVPLRV